MITFNGPNKLIILDNSTLVSVRDIYSSWVNWIATSDNIKYPLALTTIGDPPVVPCYFYLQNGFKIKPYAGSYTLTLNDGFLYTSDSSDPFVSSGGIEPRIIYQNPVLAVGYSSGSAVTSQDKIDIAALTRSVMEQIGSKLSKAEQRTRLIPASL